MKIQKYCLPAILAVSLVVSLFVIFTSATNFMSQRGFARWQVWQQTGIWQ